MKCRQTIKGKNRFMPTSATEGKYESSAHTEKIFAHENKKIIFPIFSQYCCVRMLRLNR